ncbi:hypothetical protein NEE14_007825 [Parabacteroides sp. AD58]|uniref:Lipoprotein n=1 Tax=Parabacteroides absconsus TaxID=2951805 RepID=A0ABZ2IT03_9BACT|nr:hypothetical protein [Parabacteroides sp. AD58]MCM6903421.1 hypothetical protein [Parabacteroides sp. AD58]
MKISLLTILLGFTILSFNSCDTKIGDCRVYTEDSEIFVDGFNYKIGISGIGRMSFNINFNELDKYVYNFCKKNHNPNVYVTLIAISGEDKYGYNEYEKITIGIVNTDETRKYANFKAWKKGYGTEKMFFKDKEEYDKRLENMTRGYMPTIVPKYMPHSIK